MADPKAQLSNPATPNLQSDGTEIKSSNTPPNGSISPEGGVTSSMDNRNSNTNSSKNSALLKSLSNKYNFDHSSGSKDQNIDGREPNNEKENDGSVGGAKLPSNSLPETAHPMPNKPSDIQGQPGKLRQDALEMRRQELIRKKLQLRQQYERLQQQKQGNKNATSLSSSLAAYVSSTVSPQNIVKATANNVVEA